MNRKYLVGTEFLRHIKNPIDLYIQTNVDVGDPQNTPEVCIIRDAFKAYIRGIMLGVAAKKNADLDNEIKKVREQINILEEKHKIQALFVKEGI